MKKPKISVVIPAYNEEKYIKGCLESLKKQDYKGEFEVIVVDSSTDRTCQIAQSFGAKVIFTPRSNPAWARQEGFKEAKGEIIATLDADNTASPSWLSAIDKEFSRDRRLVSIFGFIKPLEGHFLDKVLLLLGNFANIAHFYLFGRPVITGTNQAIKKDIFEKIGGFEPLRLPAIHCDIFDQENLMRNLRNSGRIKFLSCMVVYFSMRRFHQFGYFPMFWSGFLAWFDLVFSKRFQFHLSNVRDVRKRSNLIFDQLSFLLFALLGISLAILISPLLLPVFFLAQYFVSLNLKVFLQRLAITGLILLIGFLPFGSYILVRSSLAEEKTPLRILREKISALNIDEKIKNMTEFELSKLIDAGKIKVILER
jgi:glycosyltransferase involved in cell wall biosynthesis